MLHVNGQPVEGSVPPSTTLLELLRDHLGLRRTKESCGRGECGACTILVNGRPTLSCIQLAAVTEGEVTTIEALGDESLDLRQAFAEFGGFQCGFCTAGQVVHATAILRELANRAVDDLDAFIRHRLSGNICRCTGYIGIVNAVRETHLRRSQKRAEPA